MAISSGTGPHAAWLIVNGNEFPVEHGSVSQQATRRSGTFSAMIPLSYEGAADFFASVGDNETTVKVMTRGQTATLMTGEVDSVDFDYIGRTLQIHGRDKSAKLHENKTSEKWLNKKGSDIVRDLIGRAGLSGNVTESQLEAGKMLQQDFVRLTDNVPFSRIIHKIAEMDGMRWFVDASGTFHYVPFGSPIGTYSIEIDQNVEPISSDCLQLDVKRNLQAGKAISATVKSWHPKLKKVFSYTSNIEGKGGPQVYRYHIPTLTQDHVTKHAKSRAAESARHEFTVNATVVGDPAVAAGMALQVSGTNAFDQTYDIDSVSHEFGMSGHTTKLTARSAKEGREAS